MFAAAAKHTVLAAVSIAALAAGSIAAGAGGAAKRDNTPPTVPGNVHVTSATESEVRLAWTAAEDDVGVDEYRVYVRDEQSTTVHGTYVPVDGTSYVVSVLSCGESADVAVTAVDAAGNESPRATTTISTAACADATAPTKPSGFRQIATTQSAVVLTWDPSTDDTGVVAYGVYRDVARIASPSEPNVTLSGLTCGKTYVYSIDAADAAGNRSGLATAYVNTASCDVAQAPIPAPAAPSSPNTADTASTSSSTASTCPAGQFRGQYFGNAALSGSPVKFGCEPNLDYNWGQGGPGSPVPTDKFSARWVGSFGFPAGDTTFTATADDGIRVWVDGTILIDAWSDQPPTTYTAARALTAGSHEVKVEYYENLHGAVASLKWATSASSAPPTSAAPSSPNTADTASTSSSTASTCPAGQFRGQYFGNAALSGSPVKFGCEPNLDYNWGQGGPGSPVPTDKFSARWVGSFGFPAGDTTFTATADDGIRVWVDGTILIDAWSDQPPTTYTAARALTAGSHEVKVEYYENTGGAVASLKWATSAASTCPAGQFRGQYFGNAALSGSPVKFGCEPNLDYNWGQGGPGSPVPTDKFSARWVGSFGFPAGDTTFTATADDGIRVWVDGTILIDAWSDQPPTTYTAARALTAGSHEVKVEYYENTGGAVASLKWATSAASTCPAGQFRGQYFGNAALSGSPVKFGCEPNLDYNWGQGGPGSPVPTDKFSARWVGSFGFPAGDTTFTATADDGIRVWVDGTILIDAWSDQPPTTYTAARALTAGSHEVKVEYYENTGGAVASLKWATSTSTSPPSPTLDTIPPSEPDDLAVAAAARSSVELTWSPSTDNRGVTGYGTYADGSQVATTPQPGTTVTSLDCGTAYVFAADAQDAAGNRSTKASVIGSTAACTDTQAPTAPTNLVATSRTATSIALVWSPSTDNVGVVGYGLYRGGAEVGMSPSTTGIFSGLTCGTNYTLAVDARDAAGQRSTKTTVLVSTTSCVDTTPPTAPTGLAASSISQTGLTLSWNASTDNVGVTGYDVLRDGTKTAYVSSMTSAQTGLACGMSYTFRVIALDSAGNASQPAQIVASTAACATQPPACQTGQFTAQYYGNTALSGAALKVACEPSVNHNWALSGPGAPVPADQFSARWVGNVTFPGGATTFAVTADDGVRVWVDSTILIDAWYDQSPTTYTAERTLTAGTHQVKVEYYENLGDAVASVSWTQGSSTPTPSSAATRWFSDSSPWNSPIPQNPPIVSQSGSWIGSLHDSIGGINVNQSSWTPNVFTASSSDPVQTMVNQDGWTLDSVPIPSNLRPSSDSDAHAVILAPWQNRAYEFFMLRQDGSGRWTMHSGIVTRIDGSGWWDGTYSANGLSGPWGPRASGASLRGGLIRPSDVQAGVIPHALACAAPKQLIGPPVSPARTSDGSGGGGAMPMGSRLQLDPSLNVSSLGLEPGEEMVARALQTYGAYVVDSSSAFACYAQGTSTLGGNPYPSSWSNGIRRDLVLRMRIVAPPSPPAYDSRATFGQPHR